MSGAEREFPTRVGDLSTWALSHAIETLEREVGGSSDLVDQALATIRLIDRIPRACPWYGTVITAEPGGNSVTGGTMMRNAFEAVGDTIEVPTDQGLTTVAKNWFTQLYLGRWRKSREEYYAYLEALTDPLRYERDRQAALMTGEEAQAEYGRIRHFLEASR